MSLKHLFTDLFTGRAGSSLPQGLCSSRGEWGLLSSCGVWASRCGLLVVVASPVAEQGLQGVRASVVVVHWLSCSAACGIFLDQGLNTHLLHWQVDSLPLSHQGNPQIYWVD